MSQLNQHIGACRFVYNWGLERKIKSYELEGKSVSRFDLNKEIVHELKPEYPWLKEVNSQSLQGAITNLESAFTKFFREKTGFPNFKSKKNATQSFSVPQHYVVDFDTNRIKLPKIGWVKAILHRRFEGDLKTATVSMTRTGKYFISILVDDGKELPKPEPFDYESTVGIDVGITHFATLSTGEKIENPKHLKNSLGRLKVLQRRLSRTKKGSNNREKARLKLAKQHEKIANQRRDFLHKTSHRLASENQAIATETLNVKGMMKNHHLAMAISDVSWSEFFRQLEYKAAWYGKTMLTIGQFQPSTKICSVCGTVVQGLTLADREWSCQECGTVHDRDINAAINIKKFALQDQNIITLGQRG
jgi:putative transposase